MADTLHCRTKPHSPPRTGPGRGWRHAPQTPSHAPGRHGCGRNLLLLSLCTALLLLATACSKKPRETASSHPEKAPPAPHRANVDRRALLDAVQRQGSSRRRPHPRRYARRARPATARAIAKLSRAYDEATDAEERAKILDSLAEYCDPAVLPIVEKALNDESADVRAAALEALEGYTSKDVVPLAMKGLLDKDADVRIAAMNAIACVENPAVVEPIALAFTDTDEDVRDMAFDVMQELDYDSRMTLLEEALRAPTSDVRIAAISELEDISNHDAMDLIIESLRDTSKAVREEAASSIWFLVSEEFDSYEEAKAWWAKNQDRFDDELFEKD